MKFSTNLVRLLSLFWILGQSLWVSAQTGVDPHVTNPIVPPTPNAMKITEFGGQRPNLYTGTASVSIPLYTIDFDGWKLPLTLSYNATGIRTNEEASEVGLGWALSATGVISRTIRGGDDLFKGTQLGYGVGFVYDGTPLNLDLGYDQFTQTWPPPVNSYYYHVEFTLADTQPDVFTYNFFGYTGSFTLSQASADPDGKIYIIKLTQDATSIQFNSDDETFSIITPDGFRGDFTVKEKSTSAAGIRDTEDKDLACGEDKIDWFYLINQSGRLRTVTSWYLSKITSPRGLTITFNYDVDSDGNSQYISDTRAFAEDGAVRQNLQCLHTIHEHVYQKSIISEDAGIRLDFTMEDRDDLRKNIIYDHDGVGYEIFPNSLKLKRYTGIQVSSLIPESTLIKTITFTQNYFNQQYYKLTFDDEDEVEWLRSRLDKVTIDDQVYRFWYYLGNKGLPNKFTKGIDYFGYYNGKDENTALLDPLAPLNEPCLLSAPYSQSYDQRSDRWPNLTSGIAGLLEKEEYPTGGYSEFEYESPTYLADQSTPLHESPGMHTAGGAIIKSIKDYTVDGSLQKQRSYLYSKDGSADPNQTSGQLMVPLLNLAKIPLYVQGYQDSGSKDECYPAKESSTSIPGNDAADGKIIGFDYVREIVQGSQGNYTNYYHFENNPTKVSSLPLATEQFPNINGQIIEERNYDADGKVVRSTINDDYKHDQGQVNALAFKAYPGGPLLNFFEYYHLDRTFTKPFKVTTYVSQTPSDIVEDAQGQITDWGHSAKTETNFTFNSNFLPKSEETEDSNGDILRTEYWRAADYADPKSGTLTAMEDPGENLVEPVIEEIKMRNGQVVSATGNKYDDTFGPILIHATYQFNPSLGEFQHALQGDNFLNPYEKKADFTYNTDKFKVLEYTPSDGPVNSFVWGYNGLLPIVHGVGITYNNLKLAYDHAVVSGDYESTLRNDPAVGGKPITTYQYKPLVGVTSITDPAGIKKSFEYDQYGRLVKVKDNDNNTIQQYGYHFREIPPEPVLNITGTLDFGTLTPDFFTQTSLPYEKCSDQLLSRVVTLTNTGKGDLTIYSISILPNPDKFHITWQQGTIAEGTSVNVIVTFDNLNGSLPFDTYQATFTVQSNTTVEAPTLQVSATYAPRVCNLSVNPSTFDFGETTGNIPNQSIYVTNNGNAIIRLIGAPLNWDGTIEPLGNYASYTDDNFSITDPNFSDIQNPGTCIAPGESLRLTANFLPPANGTFTTHVSLITDVSGCQPLQDVITLKGQKVPVGTSLLSITSPYENMPDFTDPSVQMEITLHNLSMFPADIDAVSSSSPYFTITPSTGFELPGLGEKTFTLTFTPQADDFSQRSTTILFHSQFSEATISRAFTGQRTLTQGIGFYSQGTPVSQVYTLPNGNVSVDVKNEGNGTITITGAEYGIGQTYSSTSTSWSASFSPQIVAPQSSATLNIHCLSVNSVQQQIRVLYGKIGGSGPADEITAIPIHKDISVTGGSFAPFTGTSTTTTVTISNTGNTDLTISDISSSNTRFTLSLHPTPVATLTISPGGHADMTVTYTPTDFTLQSSTLTFSSDATNMTSGPATLDVQAQRTMVKTISISPSQLNILGHGYGYPTITNTGNTTLTLSGIQYANPGQSFGGTSTSWNATYSPSSLPQGQTATLTIGSISSTSVSQDIRVLYDKTGAYDANDQVRADPVNKNIIVSGGTFSSFTGSTATATVTISNSGGNTNLTVTSITSSNGKFTLSLHPTVQSPLTIAPDGQTNMTVTYTPTDFSQQSSTLTFVSDATNVTGNVTLTVTAQRTATRTISVTPTSVTASGYVWKYVTVKNTGNDNLSVTGLSYAAINSSTYNSTSTSWTASFQGSAPPFTLTPNQTVTLQLMPIGSNPQDQKVRVLYNKTSGYTSSDEVQALVNVTRVLSGVPTSYDFPDFTGTSESTTITISNTGNSPLTVNSITSNNSKFTISPTSSITLDPGDSRVETITYTPTNFTQQSATVTVSSDKTSGNSSLSLTAQRIQYYHISASTGSIVLKPSMQTGNIYLTNTGNVNAVVSSVSNNNTAKFTVTTETWNGTTYVPTNCPITLTPGQVMDVEVKSNPTTDFSSATGMVTITPGQGSVITVNLARSPTP